MEAIIINALMIVKKEYAYESMESYRAMLQKVLQ